MHISKYSSLFPSLNTRVFCLAAAGSGFWETSRRVQTRRALSSRTALSSSRQRPRFGSSRRHGDPPGKAREPAVPELQPGQRVFRVRHGRRFPHLQLRPIQGDVPSTLRRRRRGRHRRRRDALPLQHPRARRGRPLPALFPQQGDDMGRPSVPVHRRAQLPRRGPRRAPAPRQDRRRPRAQDLRLQLRGFKNSPPDGHRRQPQGSLRALPDPGQHRHGIPRPQQGSGPRGTLRRRRHQVHLRARRRSGTAGAQPRRRTACHLVREGHPRPRLRPGEGHVASRVQTRRGQGHHLFHHLLAREGFSGVHER